jgi:excisionase family DNA binding protein
MKQLEIEERRKHMPNSQDGEAMVSVEEVAKYLNVSRSWIYRNRKRRNVPHKRVGKHLRFLISEIQEWKGSG